MDWYYLVRTIHIISATIVFGTGIGIAFFMFRTAFTDNLHEKMFAARTTVLADYCFTLPAVIIQLVSGIWLIWYQGYDPQEFWLLVTYGLYVLAAMCWIPVVWIQIQLKKMVQDAINANHALPVRYSELFRIWFLLGWPAFVGLVIIFYMMIAKPV